MKITDSPVAGRIWAVLTAVLVSYAGYDQYEKRTAATETTVNVNLESVPDEVIAHAHGEVLSRSSIESLVKELLREQDRRNLATFKQLEAWEK